MKTSLPIEEIIHSGKLKRDVLKCNVECFLETVFEISEKLQINPQWLMVVMELETAGTFDPAITNQLGYTGLIQFGANAAKDTGTTRDALREMHACEQLEYVYRYLKPYVGRMNRLCDVYLAVFFPVAIGKPDGWVLQARGLTAERVARWNPLFDIDKNGKIQIWEIKRKLEVRIPNKFKWINS